eukprot:GHVQ01000484.1.p1 GENE.GHVQ01000484.1~~GHVQ01000484.1.p1  ORF type:complete len:994 (+),score=170.31 GHVQ01000484.1:255-2984(+)
MSYSGLSCISLRILSPLSLLYPSASIYSQTPPPPNHIAASPRVTLHNSPDKAESHDGVVRRGLLLSSHYDAFPQSPGAADAGACVAIIAEVVRQIIMDLSDDKNYLSASVTPLFANFNGGEEVSLLAAHGFATQHPWSNQIFAFINLEASGSGGKESLFQYTTGGELMLQLYKQLAPYPNGNSIAQDLFQAKLIPGETDFRIFRDVLHIEGVDLAWSSIGYNYHTRNDVMLNIPPGSIQRYGENVLALSKGVLALTDYSYTYNTNSTTSSSFSVSHHNYIFFDFIGLFVFLLSRGTLQALCLIACLLCIVTCLIRYKSVLPIRGATAPPHGCRPVVGIIVAVCQVGISILSVCCLGAVLTFSGLSLGWYSHMWIAPLLYGCTTVVLSYALQSYLLHALIHNSSQHTPNEMCLLSEETLFVGGIILWSCLLVICFCTGLSVVYVPLCWIISALVSRCITLLLLIPLLSSRATIQAKTRDPLNDPSSHTVTSIIRITAITHSVCIIPSLIIILQILVQFVDAIIPTLGRASHTLLPGEVYIALIISVPTALVCSTLLCPLHISPSSSATVSEPTTKGSYRNIWYAAVVCLMLFALQEPFTDSTPKRLEFRHFVTHERAADGHIANSTSGIWIRCMDALCLDDGSSGGLIYGWLDKVSRGGTKTRLTESIEELVGGGESVRTEYFYDNRYDVMSKVMMSQRGGRGGFYSWPMEFPRVPINKKIMWIYAPPPLTMATDPMSDIRQTDNITNRYVGDVGDQTHLSVTKERVFNSISLPRNTLEEDNRQHTNIIWSYGRSSHRLDVEIRGAERISVVIHPQNIAGWSYSEELPPVVPPCNCYWISYAGGRGEKKLRFWLTLVDSRVPITFTSTSIFYDLFTKPMETLRKELPPMHPVVPLFSIAESNMWTIIAES